MDVTDQLTEILPTLSATVDRIYGLQLDQATPCSRFTVHDVLNHMIVGGGTFAYLFRGERPPEIEAPIVYGWVPAKEFRQAMDDLLDAVNSPGALDRMISTPLGEMRGDDFARFVAFDGLVHGYDLASATGQEYDPPADVVAAVDEFARTAITPEMRDGDTFAAPTSPPDDATPLERLVAFSGRTI